jgi:hypothetical protein
MISIQQKVITTSRWQDSMVNNGFCLLALALFMEVQQSSSEPCDMFYVAVRHEDFWRVNDHAVSKWWAEVFVIVACEEGGM